MKITGELLRAERLKQDLKINDVAFALKLSSKVIQSIEDGDSESLPAKTFVRGFVKGYAEFLKLDSAIVLRQFQEEMGSTSPVPKSPPPMAASSMSQPAEKKYQEHPKILNQKIGLGLTQRHVFIFISVSLFVAALATINHFINKYSKERVDYAETTTVSTTVNSSTLSADLQMANSIKSSETKPMAPAINSESSAASIPPTVAEEKTAPTQDAAYPTIGISNGKPVEVLIEAKKDIVIHYAKGNSAIFEKILIKENTFQIIRSNLGLHLRADDGSNLILTVNGFIRPTTKSKPLQLTF